MDEVTLEDMDIHVSNCCAQALKLVLTVAQAHAVNNGKADLADSIAALSECRLIVHAHGNDLHVEVLAAGPDGGTASVLLLDATAEELSWTLH